MKKMKINYYLACQLLIIFILSFFAGYFLPLNIISNNLKIFEIVLTIFGLLITLYAFIQGVIQNSKNNLIKSQKQSLKEKFLQLDGINEELKNDILLVFVGLIVFGLIALFFGGIENIIWQTIFVYMKYFLIFSIAFILLDVTLTMFKLVKINNLLNLQNIDDKGE